MINIDIPHKTIERNGMTDHELYIELRSARREQEKLRQFDMVMYVEEEVVMRNEEYVLMKINYKLLDGWSITND